MLEEFLANIREHGLAKSTRFKVDIVFPQQIHNQLSRNFFDFYGVTPNDARRLSLFCETAGFPGKSISTTNIKTHGPTLKIPYNFEYGDVSMTFYTAEDMKEKRFFDAWQSMIGNPATGDMNYLDEYSTTVNITQLKEDGQPSYSVVLERAYPIAVTDMGLSMAEENAIHKTSVTFSYRKWTFVPTNSLESTQGVKEVALNVGPISNKLPAQLAPLARAGLNNLTNRFNGIQGVQGLFSLFK